MPTYTHLYRLNKRVYSVGDARIPIPGGVGIGQAIAWFITQVIWFVVLTVLQVPFNALLWTLWVGPPLGVAWAWERQVAEHKQPGELLASQVTYVTGAKTLSDGANKGRNRSDDVQLSAQVWTPNT